MSTRPNILFIFTDQQTLRAMSACGNPHLRTPHMDSLAAAGVRFAKSYCTSPVCGPARSSLMTSRMPHETKVDVNGWRMDPSVPNIGQVFRQAGYETAYVGKWHLPEGYCDCPAPKSMPGFEYLVSQRPRHLGTLTDGLVADRACEFLRRPHERPFLLIVSLHNPHDICYWIMNRDTDAITAGMDLSGDLPPLPDNFACHAHEPEFIARCRLRGHYGRENTFTTGWDERKWRAYLSVYYRLTERVDAEVGRILSTLRQENLEEDTLVVFTSDHGEGSAAHGWAVKLMLYDEPATVPLVVSWKGVTPAGVADAEHLASGLDVPATLWDDCGIDPPSGAEGVSLRPVIERPELPGREFLVCELQPDPQQLDFRGRMVRTKRYKYIAFSHGRRPEMLFDMDRDPGEMRDLAGDASRREELRRHRGLLRQWVQQTGDVFSLPAAEEAG